MKNTQVYSVIKKAIKIYNLEIDKPFVQCEKEIRKINNKINGALDKMNLVDLTIYTLVKKDLDNRNLNTRYKDLHKIVFNRNKELIESELLDLGIILNNSKQLPI